MSEVLIGYGVIAVTIMFVSRWLVSMAGDSSDGAVFSCIFLSVMWPLALLLTPLMVLTGVFVWFGNAMDRKYKPEHMPGDGIPL